jgi:HlyD family secretion protein
MARSEPSVLTSHSPAPDLASLKRGTATPVAMNHSRQASIPPPTRRWKTRVLVPVLVLGSALGLVVYAARGVLVPALDVRVVPVVVKAAAMSTGDPSAGTPVASGSGQGGAGAILVQAPGWIEPDPFAVGIPALAEGVVKEVLILEGDRVESGQVVARLMDEELRIAERVRRATVAEREADLSKARASVAPARAAVQVEEAAVHELRDEINRQRELVAAGAVSAGEFHRREIRLQGLEARVTQARAAVEQAEASVRQAEAALETARASLAEATLRLERAEIRSPVAGVVMTRLIEPGTRITMGSKGSESSVAGGMSGTVMRLYDPARLQVRVDVPLADASKIGMGTPAQITTEALAGASFAGAVTRVVHEANIQRNTVQFKVAIKDPSPLLKPEMLTRVRFQPRAESRADGTGGPPGSRAETSDGVGLYLPASVLLDRKDGIARVWIARPVSPSVTTADLRDLTLDPADSTGEAVRIVSGVTAGERAISGAPATLRPGKRVRVVGEAASANP